MKNQDPLLYVHTMFLLYIPVFQNYTQVLFHQYTDGMFVFKNIEGLFITYGFRSIIF